MTDIRHTGDELLSAWLKLTSTLRNTRLVKTLTFNETHVMGILLRHTQDEPMTATDLIRQTRLLKSQMNKLLTSLENRGFITRLRSDMDKRLIHIRLTSEGQAAYMEEHRDIESLLAMLITRFGPERTQAVVRELDDLNAILDDIIPLP